MNFYGIDYLESQSNINDYVKYALTFGLLILLLIVFSLYMRHRLQTKYRDLTLIAFLSLFFILGIQYTDYTQNRNNHSQSSQMVNLVKQVAKDQGVETSDIFVNSTQLTDGTIIKVKDTYYKMSLSTEQNSYTLQETYLINPAITETK